MEPQAFPDDAEAQSAIQYAVARALAGSENVLEAATAVITRVSEELGWTYASFWLVDPAAGVLRPGPVWPADSGSFGNATMALTLEPGDGLPGIAWSTGQLQWVADAQAYGDFRRADAARAAGVRTALAVPIIAGTKVVGVMEFFSTRILQADSRTLRTLTGLGYQIGEFIERKRAIEAEMASQQLVAATIQVALDSIVTIDAGGRILEFNPAAERTFGYRREDALGQSMSDLIVPPEHREGHRRGMERYMATGEARVLGRRIEITAMRSDGSIFPIELAIQRVPVPGKPVFTAYIRDISEARRLEASQRLLLDASAILTSSLHYEETLKNLSRVIVPSFADWYAADLIDDRGEVRRIEVAHRDPAKVELVREMAIRYPPRKDDSVGLQQVLRTGISEMMAEIPEEMLERNAIDAEHLELIRSLGLLSYIIVPLRNRLGVVGALTLVTAESKRRYDERDRSIAEELAARAGQAIENARLFSTLEEQREALEQQATELEVQSSELEDSAAELEAALDDLRSSNEELQRRTSEAESARLEADDANKAKSDFLASMSHELRTPLNAIIGYAQLLEIGVHGSLVPKQLEDLGRITRSAQHLLGLINDILNFAKVEAGHVQFDIEAVEAGPILARVEEMVAPQARAKSLDYTAFVDCPDARVCADPDKLMQILVNLLSNAVRYTEPGGSIRVECRASDDRVMLSVADTGVGIPADRLDDIFEPFIQVNHEYAGQHQGTGLGLAISRELARGMGGELAVRSTVGNGSVFTLTLKRETSTARSARSAASRQPPGQLGS